MDKLKKLQDEAAEVADRIDAVRGMDLDNDSDIKARDMELEGLVARAESLAKEIDFEKRIADSAANLRSVVDRCTPAPEPVAKEERAEVRIEPAPFRGRLRAFDNHEAAYRCGQWLAGTFLGDQNAKRWCLDHGVEARAMGESTMAGGGFAVPEEMSSAIIRNVEQYGVAPSAMQQVPMSSDTLLVPKRLTGVTGYWVGESSEITTSDPTGTQVQLVAKKLACGTRVANELLADSIVSVADWLVQEFSLELAKKIDEALLGDGDGTSTYGGMQSITTKIDDGTHTASVVDAAAGNDSFEDLDLADFSKALGALPRYALGGAAWYISPAGYHASIERLQMAGAGSTADIAAGGVPRFLGLPVVQTLVMDSTLGTDAGVVKVLVGDAALAGIYGVRNQVNIRSTVDEYARYDQTAWYATLRVDGNWHSLGDTSDAGPMIALKTTA
jgi:HK97 family phage major capsid protein